MKVQISPNTVISIRWFHNYLKKKKVDGKTVVLGLLKSNRFTDCIIELGTGPEAKELATARALCYKGDIYCKCDGRKVSLQKAIEAIGKDSNSPIYLDKEMRREIWKKYTETTKCSFTVENTSRKNRKRIGEVEAEVEQSF